MFPAFEQTEDLQDLINQTEETPAPWTYRFNWQTRQFIKGLDGRYLRTESYAEYLAEAAKKILNTKRFQYGIYTDRYGVDFLADIGKLRAEISLPVIKAQAEEALEAHSEIEQAEVTDIHFDDNSVVFHVSLQGLRGPAQVEVNVWQR
jgi:hypothetical protein